MADQFGEAIGLDFSGAGRAERGVDESWTAMDGRKLEIHPPSVQPHGFLHIFQRLHGWTKNWTKLDAGWMDAPPPRGASSVHFPPDHPGII